MQPETKYRRIRRYSLRVFALGKRNFILLVLAGFYIALAAFNGTLIFDDLYLVEFFPRTVHQFGLLSSLKIFFFNLDLGVHEYRLYGVSRILHMALWTVGGTSGSFYAGVIALAQFLSGILLWKLLQRVRVDSLQALVVASIWVLSPFGVTSCFHHYSYLLLPVQLILLTAAILQNLRLGMMRPSAGRAILSGLGFLLATTGESHFPVAIFVFLLVLAFTPSDKPRQQGLIEFVLVSGTMVCTVVLHRVLWSLLTAGMTAPKRYTFGFPTWSDVLSRSARFFSSIGSGLSAQIRPILELAGLWYSLALVLAAILVYAFLRRLKSRPHAEGVGLVVPLILLCVFVLSVLTIWVLSVSTDQVSAVFPRRYGYVPNTVLLMAIGSLFASPLVVRGLGLVPLGLAGTLLVSFWLSLMMICLPTVRAQDARVWNLASRAIGNGHEKAVLFVNSWDHFSRPGFVCNPGSPGVRGSDFPEVFESPLSGYWWESQYAVTVLGAKQSGYRTDLRNNGLLAITGNGLIGPAQIQTSPGSMVVIADAEPRPSAFPTRRNRIRVFDRWTEYMRSPASRGVTLDTGWSSILSPIEGADIAIDLGSDSAGPGTLPDQSYRPVSAGGPLSAYGYELSRGAHFTGPASTPLEYLISNRWGETVYRLDFTDSKPKRLMLDFLDVWHPASGDRAMDIDIGLDGDWFSAASSFDPASYAPLSPVSLSFSTGGARVIQIRVVGSAHTRDVPFLSGIRIEGHH